MHLEHFRVIRFFKRWRLLNYRLDIAEAILSVSRKDPDYVPLMKEFGLRLDETERKLQALQAALVTTKNQAVQEVRQEMRRGSLP